MKKPLPLAHEFVEFIPDVLEDGKLYVSIPYATVVHKCCCGCRREVVTPLSPTDWKLIFDGKTISLDPSIGNWGFPCRSHYWIRRNEIKWAEPWSPQQIKAAQAGERLQKVRYFGEGENQADVPSWKLAESPRRPWWRRLWPRGK